MNKQWHIHIMEYYTAVKGKEEDFHDHHAAISKGHTDLKGIEECI